VNVAYLLNTYPMTSTTFIRREIEALEELGVTVQRYVVRKWDVRLVDPQDVFEQSRAHYLLTANVDGLVRAVVKEAFVNSRGLYRSVGPWFRLVMNSKGGLIRHVAYWMEAIYFRQVTERDRVNHVHVHFATNATAVAMLARVMGGPTYSFTVHGPDEFVQPQRLSFELKTRHAAFVLAISDYCKRQLIGLVGPENASKILVARCGLAIEEFPEAPLCGNDNQTFVCVGRLCPQKGQLLIPKAVAALRAQFPNLKVLLIGDGESRGEIQAAIVECGVQDQVEIRGWMANRDVLRLVRNSRALLLPSFAEGLPIVLMEALAICRPVITTSIAGTPELVDASCGWLISPGGEDALIDAMRSALECTPAELARKGAEGRARVVLHHDGRTLARFLRNMFQIQVLQNAKLPIT